jgi:serine phosphatase RsbU (regulator of sigma subunit)
MSRGRPPAGAGPPPVRSFLRLLWRAPLFALPFGLFSGFVSGGTPRAFEISFLSSLLIAYCTGLMVWAARCHVIPRIPSLNAPDRPASLWARSSVTFFAALLGVWIGALGMNAWILPGFLSSVQSVVSMLFFASVFTLLFMGAAYTRAYFRQSVAQARDAQDLALARRIQASFLPSVFPEMRRFEIFARNVPSRRVSGDFYDVVRAGPGAYLLAIADVAGKGVPAALLTSMLQASLRTQAGSIASVSAIVRNINGLLYRDTAPEQFATFFLGLLDEERGTVLFSNAGHNYPLLLSSDGRRTWLDRGGLVLGVTDAARFEEGTVTMRAGDRMLLYTDGIVEARNARGEIYGEERLAELLAAVPPDAPAREATERILDGVRGFLDGIEPGDDMTLMVVRALA